MKILELREDFIKYFRRNNHKFLKPSKVFNDDPSLLFVNAGMNQLKGEILGQTSQDDGYQRLCNSQICIRAGGKHNDLDDVGMDSYHLTSFEMLGNWSLNSYGKEEAINLAYDYLINHLHLNENRMYVTYFEGSENLLADEETKEIWRKYVPVERIVKGNFKDNFWMMANDGPCGVSTEIHYDISNDDRRSVPHLVNQDDPTVIEIWNIVFIEYNKDVDGKYNKLDKFYIDTGMGLERLAMVLQNKKTIYLIDGFHYLMGYAQAISNCEKYYQDSYNKQDIVNYNRDCAYRIFCDHFRTVVVALFDGVQFDIVSRGNVLRKIMRRLLTYTYLYLNDYTIERLMTKPIVKGIISDILNYHLKRVHNYDLIQKMLIDEEVLYIGKLWNSKSKIQRLLSKNNVQVTIDRLKNDGIPEEIVLNYDKIKIKKIK